jgi:hypothetical protein
MIISPLRLKNSCAQWEYGQLGGPIFNARFDHSLLEFDDVDMVLHRKNSQLCCMLQLSNNALGAQKSP